MELKDEEKQDMVAALELAFDYGIIEDDTRLRNLRDKVLGS